MMDAIFQFSEEELNNLGGTDHSGDSSSSSPRSPFSSGGENTNRRSQQFKRPSSLDIVPATELILRDSTNKEASPNSVQKKDNKRKRNVVQQHLIQHIHHLVININ